MADAPAQKSMSVQPTKKSFMTDGPTLHYSHVNVHVFWGLTVFVFLIGCYFWNRIISGGPISINFMDILNPAMLRLGLLTVEPISIFEYPWHIVVLGTIMGVLAVGPPLVAQLLNFRYSIPLVLGVIFIAKLYVFGIFVLISCFAVSCRPLRFRSRFIAIALCMAPQVLYWGIWGGHSTPDAVRWGFSFAPWIYAWLAGCFMAALILGIGHFTRYKPGLVWLGCGLLLASAFAIFQWCIGFSELDYQRFVAINNPEDATEFHDHSITQMLDHVIEDDTLRSRLMGEFYPIEPIMLREKLKEDLHSLLPQDHWPEVFARKMPDEFKYQQKRQKLLMDYEEFMNRWPSSPRMPMAMYFRAVLQEYRPDVRHIKAQETLGFYKDYPFPSNLPLWHELFESFPQSPESHEARWRIAMNLAGQGNFEKARGYCEFSIQEIQKLLSQYEPSTEVENAESLFNAFQKPATTVMTPFKLRELLGRFRILHTRISPAHVGTDEAGRKHLQTFVMLNPYDGLYPSALNRLLSHMPKDDELIDNVILAKIMLISDFYERSVALLELIQQYPQRDASIRAEYELALTKIQLWKNPQNSDQIRQELLKEVQELLKAFIELHPGSPYVDKARELLDTLPQLN